MLNLLLHAAGVPLSVCAADGCFGPTITECSDCGDPACADHRTAVEVEGVEAILCWTCHPPPPPADEEAEVEP